MRPFTASSRVSLRPIVALPTPAPIWRGSPRFRRSARGIALHSVANVIEEQTETPVGNHDTSSAATAPVAPVSETVSEDMQLQLMREEELDDLTAAQYSNLDERLDALEYHVMELTRELRLGSADSTASVSMTGSVDGAQQTSAEKLLNLVKAMADIRKTATAAAKRSEAHEKYRDSLVNSDEAPTEGKALQSKDAPAKQQSSNTGHKPASNDALFARAVEAAHNSSSQSASEQPNSSSTADSFDGSASASANGNGKSSQGKESGKKGAAPASSKETVPQAGLAVDKAKEDKAKEDKPGQLPANTLYEFNKLQAGMTELMNSGYIESVKQLRETLMIMEWDMTNKYQAKRRAVAHFERYIVQHDLMDEIGYDVLTSLYEDPDALTELLPSNKSRMLARSMIEDSLSERRMAMYHACNATAKEMATLTRVGGPGGHGGGFSLGSVMQIFGVVRDKLFPFLKLLPLARILPFGAVLASLASAIWAVYRAIPFMPFKPAPA